jgi:hypothetical protein
MSDFFSAEHRREYHEREKAYYRNPVIQWHSAEEPAAGDLLEPGYYVLHSCGEPGCCRPAGPFATPEEAREYSRVQLVAKEEERAQRRRQRTQPSKQK